MIKKTVLECYLYDDNKCLVYVDGVSKGLFDLKNFNSLESFFEFLDKEFDVEKRHIYNIALEKTKSKIAI
ncbi:hypothetical protein DESAMIL20_669 [Desulfurella amilsii]|jgi:hypothetical protein|uniref:Uncharacterized protein n=1 Tax=Desulfurella amilsii TaxID=1562698 RepID=A0A1X4XY82_9BACT|nr:hypothetical protein [Desulfurella amilsii]OSS42485.1 hypothetical protein DESAMIL20_669 [Desulfurella amilsii]